MSRLLAISLLKGFHCHSSRSFSPELAFRYEQDKWIIRLLFLASSENPNEQCVLQFLKRMIHKQFIDKDIIFKAKIGDDDFAIISVEEFDATKIYLDPKNQTDYHSHNSIVEKRDVVYDSDDFYIAKSSILNAGFGLFSKKIFHRGDTLLPFKGKQLAYKFFCGLYPQDKNCKHHEYSVCAESFNRQKFVFDPLGDEKDFNIQIAIRDQNFAPFINEPNENEMANCETVSVSSSTIALRVDIVASRTIVPNDEILMLYNRKPDGYIPGIACPPALEMKMVTQRKNNVSSRQLICPTMSWQNNNDYFRLAFWENYYVVFAKEDVNEITKKKKSATMITVFLDNDETINLDGLDDDSSKKTIIVPHGKKSIYDFFFLQKTKLSVNVNIQKCKRNEFFFDSYASRKLDFVYPYVEITKNKKTCFTRFRDVWTEEDIITDTSISDEDTVKWLKMYATQKLTHLKKKIPLNKVQTAKFINE